MPRQVARTVRRAVRRNPPAEMSAGRSGPTLPGRPQRARLGAPTPHKRHHKTHIVNGKRVSDRRALCELGDAGFVSAGALADDWTATVNDGCDNGAEAAIDHLLLSPPLARTLVPDSYQVLTGPTTQAASDHRMVAAALDLAAAGPAAGP